MTRGGVNYEDELGGSTRARRGKRGVVQEDVFPGCHARVNQQSCPVSRYRVRCRRALAVGTRVTVVLHDVARVGQVEARCAQRILHF